MLTSTFIIHWRVLVRITKTNKHVICFSMLVCSGNSAAADRSKLHRVVKRSEKIVGRRCCTLDELFSKRCKTMTHNIMSDPEHPLYQLYGWLRSGVRLNSISCWTSRYNKSFVPTSVRLMNSSQSR